MLCWILAVGLLYVTAGVAVSNILAAYDPSYRVQLHTNLVWWLPTMLMFWPVVVFIVATAYVHNRGWSVVRAVRWLMGG